jgi:phosphate transport system substrate-binding protein
MAAAPAAASYQSDLKNIYDTSATTVSAANITDATVVVYRSDSSGTANEFCKAIGLSGQVTPVANTVAGSTTTVSGAQGNAGVVSKVATTARSIGYADMGYVFDSNGNEVANIDIVPVIEQVGGPAFGSITKSTIKNAVKVRYNNPTVAAGGSTDYPVTLTRSLHYITNGEPSSVVKNYIQFAQSPGATAAINAAGMFANADLV